MINHIELAKECGAWIPDEDMEVVMIENDLSFRLDQLAAYTNAVIEICAKVADSRGMLARVVSEEIRALKVKG